MKAFIVRSVRMASEFLNSNAIPISFIAGSLVALSAGPRVLEIAIDPGVAHGESILRNSIQLSGNLLWILYGVSIKNFILVKWCSLSAIFAAIIIIATILA